MKENGKEIKPTAKENILGIQVRYMMDNGKMICSMDWELNHGLINHNFKGLIIKERKMEKEPIHGLMGHFILEIGRITKFMELVNINGVMEENMKENGCLIISKGLESTLGPKAKDSKVTTLKTKNMGKVYISGQMAVNTTENGRMVNNMELGNILLQMGWQEKGFG